MAANFREAEFRALLRGAKYPARSPDVNVADIKAQVAANEKGVQELRRVVCAIRLADGQRLYAPRHGQRRGVGAPGDRRLGDGRFTTGWTTALPLCVVGRRSIANESQSRWSISPAPGRSNDGNFNSPPAVTRAAVLYVFRCLVGDDIPLNDGCLKPLKLVIPPGTFLSPAPGAAVVAGNTEVSPGHLQRAVRRAGRDRLLAGDDEQLPVRRRAPASTTKRSAAAPAPGRGFDGTSAVQTHMTNTRMTDPEVLELRYPVRLDEFSIRRGSGGDGKWRGGDGAIARSASWSR